MDRKIRRSLWHLNEDKVERLHQDALLDITRPMLILGEAGMGKSNLLGWLAEYPGYAACTARQLINRYDPTALLGDSKVLVIDALDEVPAHRDGDAAGLVLTRLGQLGYPQFILSCRVADWRSATGKEAIYEQYAVDPIEMHLDPFTKEDALDFLSATLGVGDASVVVSHFNERGLSGMLGNPQTLELIAKVAKGGSLPKTRAELFEQAVRILRVEHKDSKAARQVAKEDALLAAGAAFASIILSGGEALVRKAEANSDEGEVLLSEIKRLPDAGSLDLVLDSRLFRAAGSDRFTYSHRRIGEYVGARWLSKQAGTDRKRKRLLSIFHSHEIVPSSLRGLHAWLVQDAKLAPAIIAADPQGIIEYGDTESLVPEQLALLLHALRALAVANPDFLPWDRRPLRGIDCIELEAEVREIVCSRDTPWALRTLVMESLTESVNGPRLDPNLWQILLNRCFSLAERRAASKVLMYRSQDWETAVRILAWYGDYDSVALGTSIVTEVGDDHFSVDSIVGLLVAKATQDNSTLGALYAAATAVSDARLVGMIDKIAETATILGSKHERPGNDALTDFAYALLARLVHHSGYTPVCFWNWLRPFAADVGYDREDRRQLDLALRGNVSLRQGIQKLALLESGEDDKFSIWHRAYLMSQSAKGLVVQEGDAIALLNALDPLARGDNRWRQVVTLVHHDGEIGAGVRRAAEPFCSNRADVTAWLHRQAHPRAPQWQVKQRLQERKRRARTAMRYAEQRKHFSTHVEQLKQGDFRYLIGPAGAYLNFFTDFSEIKSPRERVTAWLGEDLATLAIAGFEAFLQGTSGPTSKEIAMSNVERKRWPGGRIIVSALVERNVCRKGFKDVSDDRVLAGLFELRSSGIESHAGIAGVEDALEDEVAKRGLWDMAMRVFHEPQLEGRLTHVDGLYKLMRDDERSALGVELAADWLKRFPSLPLRIEMELVDRLISAGQLDALRSIRAQRTGLEEVERRRSWDAIALLVDFDESAQRLKAIAEPELLWHIRDLSSGSHGRRFDFSLSTAQLAWIASTFRPIWAPVAHPQGGSSGNTNPWDATDYLLHIMRRLGNEVSSEAIQTIALLACATPDAYTDYIKGIASEQARLRVEQSFQPASVESIAAMAYDGVPVTAEDLRAVMLEELDVVQAKIVSDDAESWRGFYDDDGLPYEEERCRDHLLGLLRQGCQGIALDPEVHVGGDKEVDITCTVGALRMPIEIKGQWHSELWKGADNQLDALYASDWRAHRRGIYLVLWFGNAVNEHKALTSPGRGVRRPQTADELREMLTARSRTASLGNITVVVLDLTRTKRG